MYGWNTCFLLERRILPVIETYDINLIHIAAPMFLRREIQQVLVEIGDKDPSFIGSREWIGAIELSFVLDKLLGVSFTISSFLQISFQHDGQLFCFFFSYAIGKTCLAYRQQEGPMINY